MVGKTVMAVEENNKNVDLEEATDAVCFAKKYKLVALKVKPVLGTLPEIFRIIREIMGNPLKDLPKLPEQPLEFTPKERLSQTSFGHISINSSTISMVLMALKSP